MECCGTIWAVGPEKYQYTHCPDCHRYLFKEMLSEGGVFYECEE